MAQKKIHRNVVEELRRQLAALQPKVKIELSLRETVAELETEIRYAVSDLGYSFADVAQMLQDAGSPVSPSTLQSYLSEGITTQKAKKGAKTTGSARTKNPDNPTNVTAPRPSRILELPDLERDNSALNGTER